MRGGGVRRARWVAAALALVWVVPAAGGRLGVQAVDSPVCRVRSQAPVAGIVSATRTVPSPADHPRLERWELASRAMSGATIRVNVLVPADYSLTDRRYKVLYLLHGHGGGADDWWTKADAAGTPIERLIGTLPLIVVMPAGGYDGWYSDWYGVDLDGHNGTDPNRAPAWETFHIRELIPFIDGRYRTTSGRDGRLVAGLSMGGFGAMSYAALHPDLFGVAASFSGAVDSRLFDPLEPLIQPLASNLPDRKLPDQCIWGDSITQHQRWVAHNPADLVSKLRSVVLFASSGDGCLPSPANLDPNAASACERAGLLRPDKAGAIATEWGVRQQNESFRRNVDSDCGVQRCAARRFEFYSPGVHDWPYWLRELTRFLDWAHTTVNAV